MSPDWTSIARYGSLVEAELAGGRLESADIPFMIDQRDAVGLFGPGHSGTSVRGVSLMVPADFADDARAELDLPADDGAPGAGDADRAGSDAADRADAADAASDE